MDDMPEDIMQAASTVYAECLQSGFAAGSIEVLAKAILAERERCLEIARSWGETAERCGQYEGSGVADDIRSCIELSAPPLMKKGDQ